VNFENLLTLNLLLRSVEMNLSKNNLPKTRSSEQQRRLTPTRTATRKNLAIPQSSLTTPTRTVTRGYLRPPLKIELCLTIFLEKERHGLNQLEAFKAYGETCLHSTVSSLYNRHGINLIRNTEQHIHQRGDRTHFVRYALVESKSIDKAIALLIKMREKRGVHPHRGSQ